MFAVPVLDQKEYLNPTCNEDIKVSGGMEVLGVGEFSRQRIVIPVKHVPAEAGSRNPEYNASINWDARLRGYDRKNSPTPQLIEKSN